MEKLIHPLETLMADRPTLNDDVLAAMIEKEHRPTAESVRHIRQGHRRPSWELAFAIERALDLVKTGLAEQLRDWKFYPHAINRPRRLKRAA